VWVKHRDRKLTKEDAKQAVQLVNDMREVWGEITASADGREYIPEAQVDYEMKDEHGDKISVSAHRVVLHCIGQMKCHNVVFARYGMAAKVCPPTNVFTSLSLKRVKWMRR